MRKFMHEIDGTGMYVTLKDKVTLAPLHRNLQGVDVTWKRCIDGTGMYEQMLL